MPPDRFEVVADDTLFTVDLHSALAICIYDAVEEAGALLHLRIIARGASPADVTDTTLATELLLLDRDRLAAMSLAATRKASQHSWEQYRHRLANTVRQALTKDTVIRSTTPRSSHPEVRPSC